MKKLLILGLMSVFLVGCTSPSIVRDIADFNSVPKTQYNYNSLQNRSDMSAYYALEDENHAFQDMTLEEFYNQLKNDKDSLNGVYYFGFDDCPYCNEAAPVLNYVAKENNEVIKYVNIFSSRFDESGNKLEKGDIYYEALQEYLDKYLDEVDKTIYVPTVIFVKNGEIKLYQLGLNDKKDKGIDIEDGLSNKQQNNLANIYRKGFDELNSK